MHHPRWFSAVRWCRRPAQVIDTDTLYTCDELKAQISHTQVVKGIVEGCRQSDCTLLGGEVPFGVRWQGLPRVRISHLSSLTAACDGHVACE